jgi:hypothetical protein
MGGVVQTSKDEWSAWTGGKPQVNWSGLDASAPKMYESPNQLRTSYTKTAQDSYNYRKTGLSTKFDKTHDFSRFVVAVWEKLVDCGMDTIAFLPDPEDPTNMLSVVSNHSRFSSRWVSTESAKLVSQFDTYDTQND